MRHEQILEPLNDRQRDVVTAPGGPLVVSAGAGTGKTTTVAARIAYRVADRQLHGGAVLAVTHSTRAAGALRSALAQYRIGGLELVTTRTIHAAARNQLLFARTQYGLGVEPAVVGDPGEVVRQVARRLPTALSDVQVRALCSEIGWARAALLGPDEYAQRAAAADRRPAVPVELVAQLYDAYRHELARRGLMDHTDLLTSARDLLLTHPKYAEVVRAHARFIVVDEYQDTDPAQESLLEAWLGPNEDVTVVGDARQAIYAFKGADPSLLATFADRHPGGRTIHLTHNYRSTPQIVAVANHLAASIHPGAVPLVSNQRPGPVPVVRALPDPPSEEAWVVAQVGAQVRSGTLPGQVGVLVRDNGRAQRVAGLLAAAGTPAWASSGIRFFDLPEIVAARTIMRRALRDGTDLTGASLVRQVLADTGFDRNREPRDAGAVWRTRHALLDWVESIPSVELLDARSMVTLIEDAAKAGHSAPMNAVFVGSVHAAKGLEFDVVYTLGWDESWNCHAQADNLAYVAVTRARRQITLTRPLAGRRGPVQPSPLLAAAGFTPADELTMLPGLPAKRHTARKQSKSSGQDTSGAKVCRRCTTTLAPAAASLGVCATHLTGPAAQAWTRLAQWRTDQAVLSGQPPYRILTNATALSLIACRPVTLADLSQVPGVGATTVARYGLDLLALLNWRGDAKS